MADERERRRKQIIRAAEKLFADSGYYGTEVEQIAKKAGISKGSVYNYFKSKEEILLSIIELGMQEAEDRIARQVGNTTDPVERLKKGVEAYIVFLEKRKPLFKVISGERIHLRMDLKKQMHERIFSRALNAESIIKEGIERGIFSDMDPYVSSTCLVGMVDFLFFRSLHEGKKMSSKYKAEQIVKLFLKGILL